MRKSLILAILIMVIGNAAHAQILHTESFSVIIDSVKKVKGRILPDFNFQTLKQEYFEFENISDISFRFKNNALTFANKVQLTKYGGENILSGGYLYAEYRKIYDNNLVLEPFVQFHWNEPRGLVSKQSAGMYLRYRLVSDKKFGFFFWTRCFL